MHHTHFDLNPDVITQILNNPAFKESLIKNIGDILKTEFIKECPNKDTVSVSVEATVTQTIKDMADIKMSINPKGNVSEEEVVKQFDPTRVSINQDGYTMGGLVKGGEALNTIVREMAWSKTPVGLKTNHKDEAEGSKAMLHKPAEMHNVISGYETLGSVLALALEQAQNGKGNERHQVGGAPFSKQPICELARLYGVGYNFGQSAKKAHETQQLNTLKAKQAELLGAINYLAAAYIVLSEQE